MRLRQFLTTILGSRVINIKGAERPVPDALADFYQVSPPELYSSDNRILREDELYSVNQFTVFAEESQLAVRWGYETCHPVDEAPCYQLSTGDSNEAFPEDENVALTLAGIACSNLVLSDILAYGVSVPISKRQMSRLLGEHALLGAYSDLVAFCWRRVAAIVGDTGAGLHVYAASDERADLEQFERIVDRDQS